MKFDVVVGNPPYQESQENNNKGDAIYNHFYDLAEKIAPKYCIISPARFLFNAGLTPKSWNKKMLNDEHLSVKFYTQNSKEVFPNTEIKAGVAILYRDIDKNFGAIKKFIPNEILNSIASKFDLDFQDSLSSIIIGGRSALKFNDAFLKKYPDSILKRLQHIQQKNPNVSQIGKNEEYELKSSTLDSLDYVFSKTEPYEKENYWKIIGLSNSERTYRWIEKQYMNARYPQKNNLLKYKVFVPESNGSGTIGEVLSTPIVGEPLTSSTPTFISIGSFETVLEAESLLKYIKTKFVRVLLAVKKITQHNPPLTWSHIPLQDFTLESDIDWSKSISEIDQQLYEKYNFNQQEVNFIEGTVKPMI